MNVNELAEKVNAVVGIGDGDPEAFHAMEDQLMVDWIRARATADELVHWERLWDPNFTRWYA